MCARNFQNDFDVVGAAREWTDAVSVRKTRSLLAGGVQDKPPVSLIGGHLRGPLPFPLLWFLIENLSFWSLLYCFIRF